MEGIRAGIMMQCPQGICTQMRKKLLQDMRKKTYTNSLTHLLTHLLTVTRDLINQLVSSSGLVKMYLRTLC